MLLQKKSHREGETVSLSDEVEAALSGSYGAGWGVMLRGEQGRQTAICVINKSGLNEKGSRVSL